MRVQVGREVLLAQEIHRLRGQRVGLHLLEAIRQLHPAEIAWRASASEGGRCFFDLLCGTDEVRRRMAAGEGVESIMGGWGAGLARFRGQRRPYLLY